MTDPTRFPDDPELTRSILGRTSGAPCARLRTLACDLVDGALTPDEAALAQAHLDHCTACAILVSALRASADLLPALADLDPGPGFTARVLWATSLLPEPAPSGWARLLQRPRIALELAYLAAAAGILAFHSPAARLLDAWRAPVLSSPLGASAGNLVQAERRTVRAVAGIFVAPEGQPPRPAQRLLASVRAWPRPGDAGDERRGEPEDTPPRPSPQTRD
ncbi:MAG TPA: zf-HC2 domain-containing protein [Holophagaceae bacterium]|nr:zf-HC2 domain-containing protein [Holophagaceae bacterium]